MKHGTFWYTYEHLHGNIGNLHRNKLCLRNQLASTAFYFILFFFDIMTVDHSRVKLMLTEDDDPSTDFINANYLPVRICHIKVKKLVLNF